MKDETTYFQRSVFTDGMLLQAADLENQIHYEQRKQSMRNRVFWGWGVVYGLQVRHVDQQLIIGRGLALDFSGREITLPRDETMHLYELFPGGEPQPGRFGICLEYAERPAGVAVLLPCDQERSPVPNRIEERFRLVARQARREEDLCIAVLHLAEGNANTKWTISVDSPVDSFHNTPFSKVERPEWNLPRTDMTSGQLCIDWDFVQGDTYCSDELPHGLGQGPVEIALSIHTRFDGRPCSISGTPELFHIPVRWAVRLFPESGTFQVAVRWGREVGKRLLIDWHAQRYESEPLPHPVDPPSVRLEPSFQTLGPGERVVFTLNPACKPNKEVRFCAERGHIGTNGCYTAPDEPGLYRVEAILPGGTRCSALVLVQERKGAAE